MWPTSFSFALKGSDEHELDDLFWEDEEDEN